MKTIKITLIIIASLLVKESFAQNNTLPASGNIGIGTLTPSAKLDVNGQMIVDSLVILKDSLYVQKKVEVGQDMKVKGKSTFIDNGKFKAELKVLGVAKMKDKLVVDGLTKMNGDAKIFGDLKIKSLEDLGLTDDRFLIIQPNGLVQGINLSGLQEFLQIATCFVNEDGTVSSGWVRKSNPVYGILHTGTNCPTKVGIGTIDPLSELDVRGKGLFRDIEIGHHANQHAFKVLTDGTANITTDITQNIKPLSITDVSSGDDIFRVMSNGSVNITTDESQWMKPLSVTDRSSGKDVFRVLSTGHVYATKILVRTTPFPDYVFKQGYNLMPLSELETYIKTNKHLPNMPTAKKVEKEGADLGEINRVLVEKTEELTLYIIALKKELDNLKTEVNQLKK